LPAWTDEIVSTAQATPVDAGGQDRAGASADSVQEEGLPFTSTGAGRASRRHRSPAMIGRFRPKAVSLTRDAGLGNRS